MLLTSAVQNAVNLGLIKELGVLRLDRLELDGHFFASGHVCAQVNITKGARANFAAKAVFFSYAQLHFR